MFLHLLLGQRVLLAVDAFGNSEDEKNPAAKESPATVATDLVNRFTIAVASSTMNTDASPTGISRPAMVMFGGTFQPRSPFVFEAQHQHRQAVKGETPDHAERIRFAQYVNIAAAEQNREQLQENHHVDDAVAGAKTLVGWRNQSVSTPSSEMRLSTPFDPMMAVFTAPERIRNPTTTTNPRNSQPQELRAPHVHRQAGDQVVLVNRNADGVRDDHHRTAAP